MKYHWIITLQQPAGAAGEFTQSTFSGWLDVGPGKGRGAVFADIYETQAGLMRRPPGASGLPNVMFFALEPDQIEREH